MHRNLLLQRTAATSLLWFVGSCIDATGTREAWGSRDRFATSSTPDGGARLDSATSPPLATPLANTPIQTAMPASTRPGPETPAGERMIDAAVLRDAAPAPVDAGGDAQNRVPAACSSGHVVEPSDGEDEEERDAPLMNPEADCDH